MSTHLKLIQLRNLAAAQRGPHSPVELEAEELATLVDGYEAALKACIKAELRLEEMHRHAVGDDERLGWIEDALAAVRLALKGARI